MTPEIGIAIALVFAAYALVRYGLRRSGGLMLAAAIVVIVLYIVSLVTDKGGG